MIEAIKMLNSENKDDFIKKYGLIDNPDVAKELLCITSNAWMILDDSLKSNSEIIMYYQPMAVLHTSGVVEYYGVFEPTESYYTPQTGFKIIDNHSRIEKYYYSDMSKYIQMLGIKIQIPEIQFPKDFDMDKYIEIQEHLCEEYKEYDDKNRDNMGKVMENIKYVRHGIEYGTWPVPVESDTYKVYDRGRLKDIIDEALYEAENNLKSDGKHK